MSIVREVVADPRTAVWHLRKGGVNQLRTWARRRDLFGRPVNFNGQQVLGAPEFPAWPLPDRPPRRPDLRVGVILDDFSRLAFRYEWDQVELTPRAWRDQVLQPRPIDLLFVESAWHGNGDAWQYALTGSKAPSPDLRELVSWCREQGVPTVFWNKEDPVHYEDFLDTAKIFDHVWTTDSERIPSYVEDLGHSRVGVLPFAAQQSIHNPIRPTKGHQARDIAFAGMYFAHKYPERREQMDLLLGAAERVSSRMPLGLEIFSRFLGHDDRYQFPGSLGDRVVGSLSYEQTLSAYRGYKVFLNVNSVVGSPSMCARRIFEITACGTPVVSTPSAAIGEFFPGDEVIQVSEQQEAEWTLRALWNSPELRDRMVHRGQRRIWAEHTYTRRVDDVLAGVGLATHQVKRPTVSALVSTNRPHQLDHVLSTLAAQQDVDLEVVVLTHGFDGAATVRDKAKALGIANLVAIEAPSDLPLGACLNRLVTAASGDVVAKIDDDDLYGPHYLRDQLNALDYSGAAVVGKQAHHMYLKAEDLTIVRFPEREHRFTDFVMGPTIVTSRDVALAHPFPELGRGEDTGFLRGISDAGAQIYSADRFGFIQVRDTNAGTHTWGATSAELLANGRVLAQSSADTHILN
ncbi:glycosyltransferase [Intrasporangium calvum]|uniref:Glycosyltransferase n=1 Tax=Intrasporangium calvum TaxID=53358 RepID=A0ABT5GJD0_9MICO|nr:glycosyltransferase [Intrasporangium calvum]MDC5698354.1 glycosyltransferase [Intrasporangium calvum]